MNIKSCKQDQKNFNPQPRIKKEIGDKNLAELNIAKKKTQGAAERQRGL